ncbi:transmembrane protein, putative [Medicago truncatula]|uniref:Transmembrane protein, putative n=1 Tax=Medicago truncatula TaxID=3880 RepID=A0A072TRJ3_MEDTR|nr:transmembrane protein, putative [Medicago truncatula]
MEPGPDKLNWSVNGDLTSNLAYALLKGTGLNHPWFLHIIWIIWINQIIFKVQLSYTLAMEAVTSSMTDRNFH